MSKTTTTTSCAKCRKTITKGQLCPECAWAEKLANSEFNLKQYPELNEFVLQWAPTANNKDRDTFMVQLCTVLSGIVTDLNHEPAKPASRIIEFNATGLLLLQALVPSLEEDTLLALRLLYYVKGYSVISDERYDQAEREYVNRDDVEDTPLMEPGSDNVEHYSERVRVLAMFIMMVNEARRKATA